MDLKIFSERWLIYMMKINYLTAIRLQKFQVWGYIKHAKLIRRKTCIQVPSYMRIRSYEFLTMWWPFLGNTMVNHEFLNPWDTCNDDFVKSMIWTRLSALFWLCKTNELIKNLKKLIDFSIEK